MDVKTCLHCKRSIRGRADKKFCNESCRNTYNNQVYSETLKVILSVNTILRKNRRILHHLLGTSSNSAVVNKELLNQKGFQFNFFTGQLLTCSGQIYHCCYNLAYRLFTSDNVEIINISPLQPFVPIDPDYRQPHQQ